MVSKLTTSTLHILTVVLRPSTPVRIAIQRVKDEVELRGSDRESYFWGMKELARLLLDHPRGIVQAGVERLARKLSVLEEYSKELQRPERCYLAEVTLQNRTVTMQLLLTKGEYVVVQFLVISPHLPLCTVCNKADLLANLLLLRQGSQEDCGSIGLAWFPATGGMSWKDVEDYFSHYSLATL